MFLLSLFYFGRNTRVLLIVFIWTMLWTTLAVALATPILDNDYSPFINAVLFTGIALLGAGYYFPGRESRLIRIAGWQLFNMYWIYYIPHYMLKDDYFNIVWNAGALGFFTCLSYHEYLSYRWNEEMKGLKFTTGAAFWSALIYFLLEKVPALGNALIQTVAQQTSAILNLMGYNTWLGVWGLDREGYFLPIEGTPVLTVSIILGCTAIEAIVIFIGSIACIRADTKRRLYALLMTLPPIWGLNLVRNVGIIHLVNQNIVTFDQAHIWIGKSFSLIVLLVLMFAVFAILPELHRNILQLFDLKRRERPGWERQWERSFRKPVPAKGAGKGKAKEEE